MLKVVVMKKVAAHALLACVLALVAYYVYLYGFNRGYVRATDNIGKPLFKCIELLGGEYKGLRK